jgi:hypothetical protein
MFTMNECRLNKIKYNIVLQHPVALCTWLQQDNPHNQEQSETITEEKLNVLTEQQIP